MNWQKVRFGDAIENFDRKRIPLSTTQRESRRGIYPYYGANGVIDYVDDYIFDGDYLLLAEDGNTVVNSDGYPTVHRADGKFWVNNHAHVFKSAEGIDQRFLFYVLKKTNFRSVVTGAAQPKINQENMNGVMLSVPELPIQSKIADVLGAYDELIENNRKRIALQEKMARELYRERFVRRAVEGVETFSLEKIAKFVRGKVIVKDATKPGKVPVVAGGLEPAYYHDAANTDAPVVTVSGSGANAGFARMYFEKVWASDCSWVDATTTKYIRFVYCFLKDKDAELRNAQKGAAQPHVHAKDVNALVVTADEERIAAFENIVTPLFDELANLTFQNRNLARQRDRLLPRLMSGKIDLDKLVKGEEVENG